MTKNNKLSLLFPRFILDLLEEGKKKLGPKSKIIPFPIFEVSKDYTPVIIDGEGDGYLWVKDGKYYKKGRLFGYREVTSKLEEEVSKIYSSETKVGLPSKVAKFLGNISKILGRSMEDVYKMGKESFWDIPEIEFFNHRKPWPYEYKMVSGKWVLVEKKFSEEGRIRKMKGKLILDDIGTATGIHPLYRGIKEKVTGTKTLYHYTPTKNVESIMKNGFDPGYDTVHDRWEKKHKGEKYQRGAYFGNQSKSVPRSTVIERHKSKLRKISRGAEVPEGWGDPGTMLTLKIPMSEYKKMKKLERDPMVDKEKTTFKNLMKTNPKFKEEYEKSGLLEKLRTRSMVANLDKHGKKDVVLLQEKVDPKYIKKIDNNWS